MTLLDQVRAISRHAESLQKKGEVQHHLRNVEVVQRWIEVETEKTLSAVEAMRGLRSIDTAPSVGHKVVEQAAKKVEAMLQGERILVAQPVVSQRTLNEVAELRKSVTKLLKESHSEWRDSTVGDLEPIVSFSEAVKQVWAEVHTEVTRLVSDVKKDRNELPTTESLSRVTKAIERLHQIPRELAPTVETQQFLVAACGSGATFEDLTEPVREWLRDQGLERRLRVRISGSYDD
jgi:hypothetical protein